MRVNDDKFARGGKRMQRIAETSAQLPAATRTLIDYTQYCIINVATTDQHLI